MIVKELKNALERFGEDEEAFILDNANIMFGLTCKALSIDAIVRRDFASQRGAEKSGVVISSHGIKKEYFVNPKMF